MFIPSPRRTGIVKKLPSGFEIQNMCFCFKLLGLHEMSIGLCANMALLMAEGGMMLGLFRSGFAYAGILLALSPQNPETTNWEAPHFGGTGPTPGIMVGFCKVSGDRVLGLWWDCAKSMEIGCWDHGGVPGKRNRCKNPSAATNNPSAAKSFWQTLPRRVLRFLCFVVFAVIPSLSL